MEGWYHLNVRWYTLSLWTLVVVLLMLPHYSESACYAPNCNQTHCPGNICDNCNDGYYLQSGSCIQCPDRCSTCASSTQCTTCKDIYWNLQNNCYSTCSTNCTNNVCEDTTGYCYACKPGTYGPTCGQDCYLCKDGQCDLRKCTNGCKDGYYQENSASGYSYCYKCVFVNCLTCSNGTYCTQCEQGYYSNYYRQTSGRGYMNCLQCYDTCMDCTFSTERCHEDCIKHCSEPENPGTTESTYESTIIESTTFKFSTSKTEQPTHTQKIRDPITSTESTPTEDCNYLYGALHKELNNCQRQIKTFSECEDQLTFGHGLATGIGITIVLFGSGVGIALFIRMQTKEHKQADENSEGHHEYVNTNMTDKLSVISSENDELNNDIHTVSSDLTNTGVTNIDSSRDYVMLGDRSTHESDYTDLHNT